MASEQYARKLLLPPRLHEQDGQVQANQHLVQHGDELFSTSGKVSGVTVVSTPFAMSAPDVMVS
jgi:hypothetical protein